MPDKLTDLQAWLRSLPLAQALDCLAIIEKLTRNTVRSPGEAKFRKINLTNAKIKETIVDVPNAIGLLLEMGWVQEGEALELPSTIRLTHEEHVIGLIEAQDWYKTQASKEKSRQVLASKEKDTDQQKLAAAIEADRKEKAAEGPITKGSVATKRGSGSHMTAGDLGIGKGGGG